MQFKRTKITDLTYGPCWQYVEELVSEDGVRTPLTLRATKNGVEMYGATAFVEMAQLQEFAKVLSDAWKDHRSLVPKIVTNLSGH